MIACGVTYFVGKLTERRRQSLIELLPVGDHRDRLPSAADASEATIGRIHHVVLTGEVAAVEYFTSAAELTVCRLFSPSSSMTIGVTSGVIMALGSDRGSGFELGELPATRV